MSYDWVTREAFDAKLAEFVDKMSTAELLSIPGMYEILCEELNNDVLTALEDEREHDYWSNAQGWVDRDSCDVFTSEERDRLDLPMEGEWEQAGESWIIRAAAR